MLTRWEKPLKEWVSRETGFSIMFGFPSGTPNWPVITQERIGGRPGIAQDVPRVRFRVWGETKTQADDVLFAIASLFDGEYGVFADLGNGLSLETAQIDRCAWLPDSVLGDQPSYVMDATLVFIQT